MYIQNTFIYRHAYIPTYIQIQKYVYSLPPIVRRKNLLVELEHARRHNQQRKEKQVDDVVEVQRAAEYRSVCGERLPEHGAVGPQGAIQVQSGAEGVGLDAALTQKHITHLGNLKLPPKKL